MQSADQPIRLANLTLSDQSPHLEHYRAQGFDVDPVPAGITVPVGLPPRDVWQFAHDLVTQVAEHGYAGAIIGGRPDAVCYLRDCLAAAGLRCFVADTARVLDREGYFVAMPVGLVEVLTLPVE